MSFVNLSLLTLGGLFVAVPLVLHLAMRPKPKPQVFPALRFLKQRQATNQRKLRLRQAILLLLRCLIILLLALALARPSVSSASLGSWLVAASLAILLAIIGVLLALSVAYRRGRMLTATLAGAALLLSVGIIYSGVSIANDRAPLLLADQKASVAAALLVDTSPRMELRHRNQSRLERAQDVANWLLGQFPKDSQVAIVDRLPAVFSVDLGAAESAVTALETNYQPSAWSQKIDRAIELLKTSDKPRKELYLLTDLTRATWDSLDQASPPIAEKLSEWPELTVHVIDLGVEAPANTAIADLELSQSTLTRGMNVRLRARLRRDGPDTTATAQLNLEGTNAPLPLIVDGRLESPATTTRGRETATLSSTSEQWLTFALAPLPYGTHHGSIHLEQDDALAVDNRRYFTLHVRAPWSLLLVAGPGIDEGLLTELLAPFAFRENGMAKFEFRVVAPSDIQKVKLADYSAVGLLDPPPINNASWQRLQQYVANGGGLAVFLGRNSTSASAFNSEAAARLLPANILRVWKDVDGLVVAPRDYSHPILAPLQTSASTIPWEAMPIFRHWVVGSLAPDSREIVELSNNKPLLLERTVGQGRVVMMTTPATDPNRRQRPPWNLLPTGLQSQSWPFMALMDRTFAYLVQSNEGKLNYWIGQTAALPVEGSTGNRMTVLTPAGSFQELTASKDRIEAPFTNSPGTYRLRTTADANLPRGFSVNLPEAATRLDRTTEAKLNEYLGAGRYQVATTEDAIVREIDQARMGKEFYPFLLPLLALVIGLEYVTSNRFYPAAANPRAALASN